jgi:predicted component of type VI protein secretion system
MLNTKSVKKKPPRKGMLVLKERRNDSIPEVSGTIGHWLKLNIRNYDVISVIAMICVIAFIVFISAMSWIFYKIYESGELSHQAIIKKQTEANDLQEIANFLSSLPIDSRPVLPMPDQLYQKLYPPERDEKVRNYDTQRKAKSIHPDDRKTDLKGE